jgi:hypothetical protein
VWDGAGRGVKECEGVRDVACNAAQGARWAVGNRITGRKLTLLAFLSRLGMCLPLPTCAGVPPHAARMMHLGVGWPPGREPPWL